MSKDYGIENIHVNEMAGLIEADVWLRPQNVNWDAMYDLVYEYISLCLFTYLVETTYGTG